MLDTIYIIDEYLAKPKKNEGDSYKPNFTIPGHDSSSISETLASTFSLSTVAPIMFPAPLLSAALVAIPSLRSLISGDKDEDKAARAQKERLLAAYIEHATFSPKQAKSEGYRFQPGHPMAGKSYRRHPLADLSDAASEHLYIPSENYDSHVLEERESELMRLLISLGATQISITKKTVSSSDSSVKSSASINAGHIASGEAGYSSSSHLKNGVSDARVFNLAGRPWKASETIDRKGFFWLAFEPSWKAVLFAREHGGCTEASLELRESTSFSEDRSFELSIQTPKAGGGASVASGSSAEDERVHLISVQFSPIQ